MAQTSFNRNGHPDLDTMTLASWWSSDPRLRRAGHRLRCAILGHIYAQAFLLEQALGPDALSAGGVEHKGLHGSLFPDAEALWAHNQAIMAERAGGTTNNPTSTDAWLIKWLWCERCRREEQARKLWHTTSIAKNGTRRRYYQCSGHDASTHRDAPMVPAEELERQVRSLLKHLGTPTEALPRILERARALVAERAQPARPSLSLAQIEQQIERLGEAYPDGVVSRERYQKRLGELQAMLEEAGSAAAAVSFDERRALDLLTNVPALIDAATPEHLRQIVGAVFSRVWVEERQVVAVTPRAELYLILVARSITMGWSDDPTSPLGSVHGVPDGFQYLHLKPGTAYGLLWSSPRAA
jgi:hypothetical protein